MTTTRQLALALLAASMLLACAPESKEPESAMLSDLDPPSSEVHRGLTRANEPAPIPPELTLHADPDDARLSGMTEDLDTISRESGPYPGDGKPVPIPSEPKPAKN